MSGIVKCGSGLGQAIIPIITAYFVIEFGWRTSCLLIGGFSLIIILAAQFLHRDPSKLSLQPLEEGFMGDTATPLIENNLSLRDALRKKYFLILALTKLLDMFCLLTIITHIVPYGTDHGLTSAQSVLILSAIGGFSIIGRILFGSLFDKFGTKLSLMTCFSVLLLSFITIQATEGLYFMLVFSFIYGVAHGGFFAIASPSVADFFGTKAHGIIFGIILFFGTLGGTAGPILAGSIFDNKGSYDIVFFILTMTALIGIGLAASLPNPINDKTNFVNTNE
jgi:MFS family permease